MGYLNDTFGKNNSNSGILKSNTYNSNQKRDDEIFDLLCKGLDLVMREKYKEAMSCIDKALRLDTGCVPAWIDKSQLYIKIHKPEEALYCIKKAIFAGKNNPELHGYLHEAKDEALENDTKCKYNLEQAKLNLELDPQNVDTWFEMADCLFKVGKFDESLLWLKKILTKKVNINLAYIMMGDIYKYKRNWYYDKNSLVISKK